MVDITGDASNETLDGSIGADNITGGAGNDTISGLDGADIIDGGTGEGESLPGGAADDDVIFGGGGNDRLEHHVPQGTAPTGDGALPTKG